MSLAFDSVTFDKHILCLKHLLGNLSDHQIAKGLVSSCLLGSHHLESSKEKYFQNKADNENADNLTAVFKIPSSQ